MCTLEEYRKRTGDLLLCRDLPSQVPAVEQQGSLPVLACTEVERRKTMWSINNLQKLRATVVMVLDELEKRRWMMLMCSGWIGLGPISSKAIVTSFRSFECTRAEWTGPSATAMSIGNAIAIVHLYNARQFSILFVLFMTCLSFLHCVGLFFEVYNGSLDSTRTYFMFTGSGYMTFIFYSFVTKSLLRAIKNPRRICMECSSLSGFGWYAFCIIGYLSWIVIGLVVSRCTDRLCNTNKYMLNFDLFS